MLKPTTKEGLDIEDEPHTSHIHRMVKLGLSNDGNGECLGDDVACAEGLDPVMRAKRLEDLAAGCLGPAGPAGPPPRIHSCSWCAGASDARKLACSEWAPWWMLRDPFFSISCNNFDDEDYNCCYSGGGEEEEEADEEEDEDCSGLMD